MFSDGANSVTYVPNGRTSQGEPVALQATLDANGGVLIDMTGDGSSYSYVNSVQATFTNIPAITETLVSDGKETAIPGLFTVEASVHDANTRALIGAKQTITAERVANHLEGWLHGSGCGSKVEIAYL